MLATGAAIAVSGSIGASSAPIGAQTTTVAPADNSVMLVGKKHRHRHRHHGRHRGNGIWWGAPLLAAPFLYNGYYGDDGYSSYGYGGGSSYGYGGGGGGNSCYRACRYERGPRYCRNNWEDYC